MKVHEALRDAVIAQLKDGYDLTYVDYDDRLMDEQINAVVAGDWETVWTSNDDWEFENRHHGAKYVIDDEVKEVVREWTERDTVKALVNDGTITDWAEGDFPYDELFDDFKHTNDWDEVLEAIKERDSSDPYKQLAHQSGRVLMRQHITGEDGAWGFGSPALKPRKILSRMRHWAEKGTTIESGDHNIEVVRQVLRECYVPEGVTAMIVYAADVGDLYDMGDTEFVEVVNPYLYIGNPKMGDGFVSDEPLHATFRIKRSDLTTDEGAWGYGWNEVTGGVTVSAYQAEIRALNTDTEKEAS